jgi:hypothetical protein
MKHSERVKYFPLEKINSTTERREGSWVKELKGNTVGRWRYTARSEYPM